MSRPVLKVVKPGMHTLVQDEGRSGMQAFGVPIGGVMDRSAYRQANWLVSNPLGNPCLEITLIGPKLYFLEDAFIAFTGADIGIKINGVAVTMYETLYVKKEDVIDFGRMTNGCRSYMSINGSWKVTELFGSVSLMSGTTLGPLVKGDHIEVQSSSKVELRSLPRPTYLDDKELRILKGPEYDLLDKSGVAQIVGQIFSVTSHSNRMGIRLKGKPILLLEVPEMISSGVYPGVIQIDNSGLPIILGADAQVSGGYPRVASLIVADMPILAQLAPGDEFCFSWISMGEAARINQNYFEKIFQIE